MRQRPRSAEADDVKDDVKDRPKIQAKNAAARIATPERAPRRPLIDLIAQRQKNPQRPQAPQRQKAGLQQQSADRQRPRKTDTAQELLLHRRSFLLDRLQCPDHPPEA
jgi:hypothetical protein